jgi:cell division protein FtsZ
LLLIVSGSNEITLDEIGNNDHIQNEAVMPILLWVLVKTKHYDAIAVTIIATGFDIEQQMEL